jgi:crossover junction endodeoxyribonuclease RuvC
VLPTETGAARCAALAGQVRILGIDPGSIRTGFGLIEEHAGRIRLLDAGAIGIGSGAPLADRLKHIFAELEKIFERGQPHEVAIESLFHAKNARSALLLGHARGVAILAAARRDVAVFEYAPQEVKKALVGTGRAEKHQVSSMIQLLLSLEHPLKPFDASDGTAVAICHAHSRRLRQLVGTQRIGFGRAARSAT